MLFDTNRVPAEDLPYVGLLKSVLGYVNTKEHTYSDLASEIYLNSGGISLGVTSFPNLEEPESLPGHSRPAPEFFTKSWISVFL